jgi:hypothetical protein
MQKLFIIFVKQSIFNKKNNFQSPNGANRIHDANRPTSFKCRVWIALLLKFSNCNRKSAKSNGMLTLASRASQHRPPSWGSGQDLFLLSKRPRFAPRSRRSCHYCGYKGLTCGIGQSFTISVYNSSAKLHRYLTL